MPYLPSGIWLVDPVVRLRTCRLRDLLSTDRKSGIVLVPAWRQQLPAVQAIMGGTGEYLPCRTLWTPLSPFLYSAPAEPEGSARRAGRGGGAAFTHAPRYRLEGLLVLTDDVAAAALDALPSFVAVVAPDGTVVRLNDAWRRSAATGLVLLPVRPGASWLAACDAAALRGASAGQLARLTRQMLDRRRDRARVEVDAITPRGRRWLDVRLRPIVAGLGLVVVVDDVTERHDRELALRHQAFHDAVTGLPNRSALREAIAEALARQDAADADQSQAEFHVEVQVGNRHRVAVAFFDIDAFRRVNQAFGYAVGDGTLRAVGERLAAATASSEVVGRWGGDEFVAVGRGLTDADAVAFVERLSGALSEPLVVEGHHIRLTASVGLALSGSLTPDAGGLPTAGLPTAGPSAAGTGTPSGPATAAVRSADADALVGMAGEELIRARSRNQRPKRPRRRR